METQEETTKGRVKPVMSKKRYKDISNAFSQRIHPDLLKDGNSSIELIENLMKDIATIMKFNENAVFHTDPEILKKRYEVLKVKAQQKGITVNELTGTKDWYQKNKVEHNKKRTEYNRAHKNKNRTLNSETQITNT